jgi:hypothetical protein
MRPVALAVLLALLAATPAAAHHADSQQNARLSSLEVKLNDALNRIAALEARVAKLEATPTPSPTPTPTASPSATPTPTSTPTATATPSPTASPTVSPTASPTATPAPTLTLTQVDGGTSYYGQFSNPLSTASSYFPVGVWGSYAVQEQANRDTDAAAGINTYVWLADPCNGAPAVRADGRFRVIYDQSENRTCAGPETAGWVLHDEIDMQQGPSACTGSLEDIKRSLPADGRFRYNNYGKGVIFWETDAQAACFVNAQDITSNDIYWFTDPGDVCTFGQGGRFLYGRDVQVPEGECRRASNYGLVVDKMRRLDATDGKRQPIWNFVEVGHPFTESDAPQIQPDEVRAAVWHSLIAGARGVVYFNHSFGGPCVTHHVLRSSCGVYPQIRQTVTAVNAQVKSLAPVLNSPTVNGATTSSGIRSMVKWDGEHFYIFAGSRENVASLGSVTVGCVGDATATVLGENRTVPVQAGKVTDNFADGNAVHVYRVDGGSSCGL